MDLNFFEKLSEDVRNKFPVLSLELHNLKTDGTVNRLDSTRENDGVIWLCIHSWEYKGNQYHRAIYGNWRDGSQHQFKSYGRETNAGFRKKEKSVYKEAAKKIKDEKTAKHDECRRRWQPFFGDLPKESETHDYLKNKSIDKNYLARANDRGTLNIPVYDAKGFVGLKQVYIPPGKHVYEKKFTYGIKITGSFCPFGPLRTAKFIYIAEGFATAASIWMALKDEPELAVAAALNTSNLLSAAETIRTINNECHIVFAADNDPNHIGERKAKYAVSKLSNAILKTVRFKESAGLSDYNDLHCEEGLEEVKNQLKTDPSEFAEIIPLGFDRDNVSYLYSTERNNIIKLAPSQFNGGSLLTHATKKYWGDRYGYKYDITGEQTDTPDWSDVVEKLSAEIRKQGFYNSENIRGNGVWMEGKRLLVNNGKNIWSKNKFHPFFGHKQNFKGTYVSDSHHEFPYNNPLTEEQAGVIDVVPFR